MRSIIVALAVAATACASTPGASDRAPPFVSANAAAPAAAADYPIAIDLPAGAYRLDPRHASVVFRIRHMGLAWFTARFDGRSAALTLDPSDPSRSQLRASVDVDSVNTGVLNNDGARRFDEDIARALGGEANPTISFTSTAIERTGEHSARMTGDLSINGQTHPATFAVVFDGAARDPLRGGATVLGFSAYGQINRSDWGVNQWRAFTGDDVQIVIEAELVKA